MEMSFDDLTDLRTRHPAWQLLCSHHAPLIISFLNRVFVIPNVRTISAANLAEKLEDELYILRLGRDEDIFPKRALDYLNDWAAPDAGWLRKFYRPGTDDAQFDLTSATEKAIDWISQLSERQFVATESRLLILFDLLKQMGEGSETDPARRLAELQKRRAEVDSEIADVQAGKITLLDDTALKDRFQQFIRGSRELLADFREVEANFRKLDRHVRERIAMWEGGKGALLEEIIGEHDAIVDSDQGKSFRAFCEFLLSTRRQDELTELLDKVLALPPISSLRPDPRMRRIHYDWLDAGDYAQRTMAHLSQQLRRFLDDQVWLENRRIMEIIHSLESKALGLREAFPRGDIAEIAGFGAHVELAMERPLFTPALKPVIASQALLLGEEDADYAALFNQMVIDKARLIHNVQHALFDSGQISLGEVISRQPLQYGLAELVTYLQLTGEAFHMEIDESSSETIQWQARASDGKELTRSAKLPRVTFKL